MHSIESSQIIVHLTNQFCCVLYATEMKSTFDFSSCQLTVTCSDVSQDSQMALIPISLQIKLNITCFLLLSLYTPPKVSTKTINYNILCSFLGFSNSRCACVRACVVCNFGERPIKQKGKKKTNKRKGDRCIRQAKEYHNRIKFCV